MKSDLFNLKATIDCYDLEKIMEDIKDFPLIARTWNSIFPDVENGQYCSFGLTDEDIVKHKDEIEWYKGYTDGGSYVFEKEITIINAMIELIYELRKYVSDTEVLVYCWY